MLVLILTQRPGNVQLVGLNCLVTIGLLAVVAAAATGCKPQTGARPDEAATHEEPTRTATAAARPPLDLSGRTRVGDASFYAKKFAGREMADGHDMDPHGDNAASKTLPLGTTAKVTNLETGQSAVVTIQDRGPYVKGRIVDLSPFTAHTIGITHDGGIARVKVAPILIPLPDGGTRSGAATPHAEP